MKQWPWYIVRDKLKCMSITGFKARKDHAHNLTKLSYSNDRLSKKWCIIWQYQSNSLWSKCNLRNHNFHAVVQWYFSPYFRETHNGRFFLFTLITSNDLFQRYTQLPLYPVKPSIKLKGIGLTFPLATQTLSFFYILHLSILVVQDNTSNITLRITYLQLIIKK